MPSYLAPGIDPSQASRICMEKCRAMCCRGPLVLELAATEVDDFLKQAERLQLVVRVQRSSSGGGWLKFSEYAGECCPMLDTKTFGCRIYENRPQRCRVFPTRPTPGCLISGG